MRYFFNKLILVLAVALAVMIGVSSFSDINAEENPTLKRLLGTWWTHDADDIPWAIKFSSNGTFRSAHTYLRLEQNPIDEGSFQLQGASLTLISSKDCQGSCRGLKGHYMVEFTKYDQLMLNEQEDPCARRKEVCNRPWVKVSQ